MKSITVTFPGGKRVDAHYDGRTVQTDQSVKNNEEIAALLQSDGADASLARRASGCHNRYSAARHAAS
jgi:hypothetical protein